MYKCALFILPLKLRIITFFVLGQRSTMAVPYMFGPGGQPMLMGQIPALMQQQGFQPPAPAPAPPPKRAPSPMTEEKLQEKGTIYPFVQNITHRSF